MSDLLAGPCRLELIGNDVRNAPRRNCNFDFFKCRTTRIVLALSGDPCSSMNKKRFAKDGPKRIWIGSEIHHQDDSFWNFYFQLRPSCDG